MITDEYLIYLMRPEHAGPVVNEMAKELLEYRKKKKKLKFLRMIFNIFLNPS